MAFDRGRAPAVAATLLAVALAGGCSTTTRALPDGDPAQALLEVAWADPTPDRARMEQLVADCMAGAGYTYLPATDVPAATSAVPPTATGGLGYGITSGPHPLPEGVDPNAAEVAALTPDEQEAYWVALDGTSDDAPDDGEWRYDWRSAGCRGWAQNQVYGDPAGLDGAAALQAELDRARLAADADPRVAELDEAWAACMAAAGHPDLTSAADAPASIQDAWTAVWKQAWSTLPPEPSAADVSAAEAAAQTSVELLATQEADLATADRTCRDTVGYDAVRATVAAEYRERFYAAHEAALREWAAASGAAALGSAGSEAAGPTPTGSGAAAASDQESRRR